MDLRLQGFICTWKGHESGACALERRLRPLLPVTVINSDAAVEATHRDWIHLGDSAYFAAQWNEIVRRFDADVMLHVQADADSDDFAVMIPRACDLLQHSRVGVYEPHVSYTDYRYDRAKLQPLDGDVMQVPLTDCTCWMIHGEIVRQFRPFDLAVNRYGWGVARVVAALARLCGRICVRDYALTVRHPQHRGYSSQDARRQMEHYLSTLPISLRTLVAEIAAERFRIAG